jgi:hypothetical protein
MQGKVARRSLTDAIADYIDRHQITGNKAKFYYKHVTDCIYAQLTGVKTTKKLREKMGLPEKVNIREYLDENSLKHLELIEATVIRYIDMLDQEPTVAVANVIDKMLLQQSGLGISGKL